MTLSLSLSLSLSLNQVHSNKKEGTSPGGSGHWLHVCPGFLSQENFLCMSRLPLELFLREFAQDLLFPLSLHSTIAPSLLRYLFQSVLLAGLRADSSESIKMLVQSQIQHLR